jgi:hypothetical protein
MKVINLLAIMALLIVANSFAFAGHEMSGYASAKVKAGVKAKMYSSDY